LSKNVAVFVDVANIFYAAKAAGVDIDYVTLLKASSAGRDLVRAYAYTGLDPENENQRNFHDFLRRHGYKVVSKDIRKYGDGKVKANLDIELVVDMMKTARNLDIAIVVSGDGDFAPAIRAVQEMGVRVEVVSFRGNTSSDLIDVADIFTDITQIAKVEKGTGRSGRRVADDDEDLSMTEVPDKMTEGTGDGRRRGRGSRSRTTEGTPSRTTSRATATRSRTPSARTAAAREAAARDAVVVEGTLVALPGEKLSRAARQAARADGAEAAEEAVLAPDGELVELDSESAEEAEDATGRPIGEGGEMDGEVGEAGEDGPRRRRRRRGGRGRGRGAAVRRETQEANGEAAAPAVEADDFEEPEPEPEPEPLPAPRRQSFSFGSVWDSQLGKGVPSAAAGSGAAPPLSDEEDLEEPAIPEYLLAERRQRAGGSGQRGVGRGGRGRGGAYAAALDRERFGGGRGSAPTSRFAEPNQRHRDPGAGRLGGGPGRGQPHRGFERSEPRGSSSEPWSEVPPEIEAMLRAQLAGSGRAARQGPSGRPAPREAGAGEPISGESSSGQGAHEAATPTSPAAASQGRRPASARRGPRAKAHEGQAADPSPAPASAEPAAAAKSAGRTRRTTKPAVAASSGTEAPAAEAAATMPKRTRRPRATVEAGTEGTAADAPATPTRRTTRRKTATGD
jgi:uncharacterized LabA/DUF88 family protein